MSASPFGIPQSQPPTQPTFKDALDLLKKDILLNLNCHHIGTIQSFKSTNQTATITINYKKTIYTLNPATGIYDPVLIDYPLLLDCPVIFLGGGKTNLTFPVASGDECFVLFNDRDIDNWFANGAGKSVATPRLHAFSDAIAIVGLRSTSNVISSFDMLHALLSWGRTQLGVSATQVRIANASFTLNTLIQDLVTQLQNLISAIQAITVTGVSTGGSTSGGISNSSSFSTISSNITTVANNLASLLE